MIYIYQNEVETQMRKEFQITLSSIYRYINFKIITTINKRRDEKKKEWKKWRSIIRFCKSFWLLFTPFELSNCHHVRSGSVLLGFLMNYEAYLSDCVTDGGLSMRSLNLHQNANSSDKEFENWQRCKSVRWSRKSP